LIKNGKVLRVLFKMRKLSRIQDGWVKEMLYSSMGNRINFFKKNLKMED